MQAIVSLQTTACKQSRYSCTMARQVEDFLNVVQRTGQSRTKRRPTGNLHIAA
jgi:hypothetical protein